MTNEIDTSNEGSLRLVADNLRKALREITDNPKGVDKFALMDMAKAALRANAPEATEASA